MNLVSLDVNLVSLDVNLATLEDGFNLGMLDLRLRVGIVGLRVQIKNLGGGY